MAEPAGDTYFSLPFSNAGFREPLNEGAKLHYLFSPEIF